MTVSVPPGRPRPRVVGTPQPPAISSRTAPRGATSLGGQTTLRSPVATTPRLTPPTSRVSPTSIVIQNTSQARTVSVPSFESHAPTSPHQSSTTQFSAPPSTVTPNNSDVTSSHKMPLPAIVAVAVVSSVVVLGALYRMWILIQRRRHRRQAAPLPPARENFMHARLWNDPDPPDNEHEEKGLPPSAPTSFTYEAEDVRISAPVTSDASSSSPAPSDPTFPLVADERTQTPTSLATEGTADPKDSHAYSASSSPYPALSPSPYPQSSLSPHPSSSQSPSPSLRPPRLRHQSLRNSYDSSLRSSIHSTSGNPSPSRQNGSRPRGAPHLPHIRNTLEIVLPKPLMPASFPDQPGAFSVNRRDSRHSVRSADSWVGAAISRTPSQARLAADDHLFSESQTPSAWRRSGVPPVPQLPSSPDEGPGE